MNYELAYRFGFHPWESALDNDEFIETITALFEEVEAGRERPFGRALDVGTGSGIWGVELAKRGWDVVGIDIVERVLSRARERAEAARVELAFVHGDVTDLSNAQLDGEFHLFLDTGTYHGLDADERAAYDREIDTVAAPDATILLLAWEPRRRGPLPTGATRGELEEMFPDWTVTDLGPTSFEAPKPVELIASPNEHWYRLRRKSESAT